MIGLVQLSVTNKNVLHCNAAKIESTSILKCFSGAGVKSYKSLKGNRELSLKIINESNCVKLTCLETTMDSLMKHFFFFTIKMSTYQYLSRLASLHKNLNRCL